MARLNTNVQTGRYGFAVVTRCIVSSQHGNQGKHVDHLHCNKHNLNKDNFSLCSQCLTCTYACFSQKEIMDVLYDVFRLPVPEWSDDFSEALLSIGMSSDTLI